MPAPPQPGPLSSARSSEPASSPAPGLQGGLVYVSPTLPGITRVRCGAKAFRYRLPDGQWLQDPAEIDRIRRLAIPPAYTQVWICPLPNGHLQATGLDARGRRQYRYHALWRRQRDEGKFEHMQAFGRALPRIRARVVRRCQQLPGQELFQYADEDGNLRTLGSGDVNDYLNEITRTAGKADGERFTAKDFRTWHGTTQALELTRLACTGADAANPTEKGLRYIAQAILAEVAYQLGNTPAVCKKSYVHPAVLALGAQIASDPSPRSQQVWARLGGATSPRGLSAAERRLLAFLSKPRA